VIRTLIGGGSRVKDFKAMSERELADYQSGYKSTAPEWKLCEEEFERRRGMPAARRSLIAIWISVAALLVSVVNSALVYYKR
jgi:hypothetical protein